MTEPPQSALKPYFWNDQDGDTGSVHIDEANDVVVLEVQSRDRENAEGVWLTRDVAARLSAWLDAFITRGRP
jgi:hypothetical protein